MGPMSTTTIALDDDHFKAAAKRARELGTTPERFIQSLIDAATMGFDELLAPVRDSFAGSGVSEDQLDQAVAEARKAFHSRSQPDQQT
jgi:hypothetical protein